MVSYTARYTKTESSDVTWSHLERNGFNLLREGSNHSIYTNGTKVIPIKSTNSRTA